MAYARQVRRLIAQIVLMLSVLAMPLGMQAAAAPAQPHSTAAMPMGHCPGEQGQGAQSGIAECTMICAAALPAVAPRQPRAVLIVCEPPRTAGVQRLDGIEPDIATPPPKRS